MGRSALGSLRKNVCPGEVCHFKPDQNATIEIDFESNQFSNSIYFKAGFWLSVFIEIPVDHDGCKEILPTCPLERGIRYTQVWKLYWPKHSPHISYSIEVYAKGDRGKYIVPYFFIYNTHVIYAKKLKLLKKFRCAE